METRLEKMINGILWDLTSEETDLYEYFDDVLDFEFTIDNCCQFVGVRVWLAVGGPTIWLDTGEGEIRGTWGTDRVSCLIPAGTIDEINEIFEELYENIR